MGIIILITLSLRDIASEWRSTAPLIVAAIRAQYLVEFYPNRQLNNDWNRKEKMLSFSYLSMLQTVLEQSVTTKCVIYDHCLNKIRCPVHVG